mgnify:CR=1 FL=1
MPEEPLSPSPSPPLCMGEDCNLRRTLSTRLESAIGETLRLRMENAAVADANVLASLLMAELEQTRLQLLEKNNALEAQTRKLATAIEKGQAADRAKDLFLANISHEIRTPLQGIIGMTELALESGLTPEQHDYLASIRSCSDFLLELINDVLDFSKLQAGKLELSPVLFDLRDTLFSALRAVAVQAHKKGLELICDVDPAAPRAVLGDPARLHQVVMNLLSNAVKFTASGEVVLKVVVSDPPEAGGTLGLTISVRDTGVGIAPENHRLVFEAFTQADSSVSRTHGGTGLGLTICERLVKLMKGKIWLSSQPGVGSEFFFTCRFGVSASAAPPASSPAILQGMKVLVAGQSSTGLGVLERMLERGGLVVHTRGDAVERFDFVVLDCHPAIDAVTEVARLRALPGCRDSHVVTLTSTTSGCRCDADARLMKPVKPSDLLAALARLEAVESEPSAPPVEPEPMRPLRILLAEDNPVNQVIASRMLAKRGHSVQVAKDGQQAVELHAAAAFDLILMDLRMPRMDGVDAGRAIRSREEAAGRHTPMLALTASGTDECRQACAEAGMDGYLLKPIRESQLLETLAAIGHH